MWRLLAVSLFMRLVSWIWGSNNGWLEQDFDSSRKNKDPNADFIFPISQGIRLTVIQIQQGYFLLGLHLGLKHHDDNEPQGKNSNEQIFLAVPFQIKAWIQQSSSRDTRNKTPSRINEDLLILKHRDGTCWFGMKNSTQAWLNNGFSPACNKKHIKTHFCFTTVTIPDPVCFHLRNHQISTRDNWGRKEDKKENNRRARWTIAKSHNGVGNCILSHLLLPTLDGGNRDA